ncbi:MAG: hypothetical protein Ct9H300mP29_8610 [Candidatus Neomarinimicrobiota bacterium]|nr:MAG: hypothetical protein Ct9H300mP29_8610 [Candidatus Neomarinimicrobiota bacterium]
MPEVDHVYMSVCRALTGRGVGPDHYMTPKKSPSLLELIFLKGSIRRPGKMELLPSIADAWKNRHDELVNLRIKYMNF